MAKVKGPLFSLSASGKFGEALEFRTGGGKTTVSAARVCTKPRSEAQAAQSSRFSDAVAGWADLSELQKGNWKTWAKPTKLNGYQLYLSEYSTQNIHPPGQPVRP